MSKNKGIDIDKYTANLYLVLKECKEAISLLKRIKDKTISLNIRDESWALYFLNDTIVLKLSSLFTNDSKAISFVNLPKYFKNLNLTEYDKKLSGIKSQHKLFLGRVEKNRNKRIAHIQKNQELGWTKKTYDEFINNGGYINLEEPIDAVEEEFEFLVSSNLPIDQIECLIKELWDLIFYDVLYPGLNKKP